MCWREMMIIMVSMCWRFGFLSKAGGIGGLQWDVAASLLTWQDYLHSGHQHMHGLHPVAPSIGFAAESQSFQPSIGCHPIQCHNHCLWKGLQVEPSNAFVDQHRRESTPSWQYIFHRHLVNIQICLTLDSLYSVFVSKSVGSQDRAAIVARCCRNMPQLHVSYKWSWLCFRQWKASSQSAEAAIASCKAAGKWQSALLLLAEVTLRHLKTDVSCLQLTKTAAAKILGHSGIVA